MGLGDMVGCVFGWGKGGHRHGCDVIVVRGGALAAAPYPAGSLLMVGAGPGALGAGSRISS